jgi:hypothetical protein
MRSGLWFQAARSPPPTAGVKPQGRVFPDPRRYGRIGRLFASGSAPRAQQPGIPEPPGTPPQPLPDPTARRLTIYSDTGPIRPRVIDDRPHAATPGYLSDPQPSWFLTAAR